MGETTDTPDEPIDHACAVFPLLTDRAIVPHPRLEELEVSCYLTDGNDLYCVVSRLVLSGRIESVSLEDCATLEVHRYLLDELYGMRAVRT